MKLKELILSLCLIINPALIFGQVITIELGEPTTTDGLKQGVTTFWSKPDLSPRVKNNLSQLPDSIQKKFRESLSLLLPKSWLQKKLFYTSVFYTWKSPDDPSIDIVVEKKKKGELLYIDFNNDEIFEDNQKGLFFPYSLKKFELWIKNPTDSKQRTGRVLLRLPLAVQKDSSKKQIFLRSHFDSDGNLNTYWTNYWRKNNPQFDGSKNTFYFTDRLNLRKGQLTLSTGNVLIGLYDYNANGLYNDKGDKIFIDLNQDGLLSYKVNSELFAIHDTLAVKDSHYIVTAINKYGNYFQIKETGNPSSVPTFLVFSHKRTEQNIYGSGIIKSKFFSQEYRSIGSTFIKPKNYTSDFLMLNFWGEWCGPCIAEIPELKKLHEFSSSEIKILSFLKTGNLKKAKEVIAKENLDWEHIKVSQKIEQKFHISSYPTNILINLNNKAFYQLGKIDYSTVMKLINES